MSATSPAIHLDTPNPRAAVDVCVRLSQLSFQRRLWRTCEHVIAGIASALLFLLVVSVVDHATPLGRTARTAILVLAVLGVIALLTYAFMSLMRRRRLVDAARDIERAASTQDNALVTFAEGREHASEVFAQPYILTRLETQARRYLDSIDVKLVAPRLGVVHSLSGMGLVLLILLALRVIAPVAFGQEARRILFLENDEASSRRFSSDGATNSGNVAITIESLRIRVVPPAYTGLGVEEVNGDAPILALAGSQIEVDLIARGKLTEATLGFGGEISPMRALGEGHYLGSFVARTSGAFETRVIADHEETPAPIVRAVEVFADVPPEARITEPRSDQLLRGVPGNPISVRWFARDDLGLADVTLKYIRSRGEADAATFKDGVVPLGGVDRTSSRDWSGGASLDLTRLGLQPGDTLVYWIEARDRNPFANNSGRSASLAIAIIAPEPVKLNLGDLGPTEIGRFLLSERMIIIQTERLHSQRARLSREELLRRANTIAADQRDFKNSFNEYIKHEGGGDETPLSTDQTPQNVEERVREAEDERTGVHMHGIPEPPAGSPSNVRDMVYAIRAMWDAENALSLGDTAKALVHERDALTRLKRAQLAVRYVPPVFARSKPIDLKRRYAGELDEIKTRLERLSRKPESKEARSLRDALAEAYAALADLYSTLDLPAATRAGVVARARETARQAANRLAAVGGDHAATIAEALGQLRIVELELSRLEVSGTADDYANRLSKSLSLLTQAAANLFAIADSRTRGSGSDASPVLPADDRRASEYFRRLNK